MGELRMLPFTFEVEKHQNADRSDHLGELLAERVDLLAYKFEVSLRQVSGMLETRL